MVGVSASTVRWWKQTGKGPRSATIGKHVKYRRKDVEAWIESLFEAQPESKAVDCQLKPLGRRRIVSAAHE
jgi:hypothetical protein